MENIPGLNTGIKYEATGHAEGPRLDLVFKRVI